MAKTIYVDLDPDLPSEGVIVRLYCCGRLLRRTTAVMQWWLDRHVKVGPSDPEQRKDE